VAQHSIISDKEFARLITTQDSFSAADLQTIERLIERYPYCQAFYYIQAAALKRSRSENFDTIIQRSSAISPNREQLFRFVEKPRDLKRMFFVPQSEQSLVVPETEKLYNNNNLAPDFVEYKQDENGPGDAVQAEDVPEVISENEAVGEPLAAESDSVFHETETDQSLEPNLETTEEEPEPDNVYEEIAEVGTLSFIADSFSADDLPVEQHEVVEAEETLSEEAIDEESVYDEISDVNQDESFAYLGINAENSDAGPEEVTSEDETLVEEGFIAISESDFEPENKEASTDSFTEESIEEEDIFEEISEVAALEDFANEDSAFDADIETESINEEVVEENEPLAAAEQETSLEEDFESIETEIPSIELPSEEFTKPDIAESLDREVELEDNKEEILTASGSLPIAVAAINPIAVPDFAVDIETVIPDMDAPGFSEFLTGAQYVENEVESNGFHVEHVEESAAGADIETVVPADEFPEERLMLDSVAARDYFVFDRSVVDPLNAGLREQKEIKENLVTVKPELPVKAPEPVSVVSEDGKSVKDPEDVSKYHDDTLPFSFLWWLHKTRKEYDSTYQPYASKPKMNIVAPQANADLNQQIIESIFHAQPELNTFPEQVEVVCSISPKKREGDLIERFIKEEPHIKPPHPTQLDTENKARRSSEDALDLVSETLAKIYIDQMLFHKAIDTYKKLSLKFPEKSTYFADLILELQKKIN